MSLGSYYYSDQLVLNMSGARPLLTKDDEPRLWNAVEGLCLAAGIPMPKLYIIDDSAPNAFATGHDPEHAALCATSGLLDKLDKTELEGVVAHELSHIRNYDIRFMLLVTVLVGTIVLMSDWMTRSLWYGGRRSRSSGGGVLLLIGLVFVILSPIIAQLMQLALSRKREFLADASGALLTRYPEGLATRVGEDRRRPGTPRSRQQSHRAPLHRQPPSRPRWVAEWAVQHASAHRGAGGAVAEDVGIVAQASRLRASFGRPTCEQGAVR